MCLGKRCIVFPFANDPHLAQHFRLDLFWALEINHQDITHGEVYHLLQLAFIRKLTETLGPAEVDDLLRTVSLSHSLRRVARSEDCSKEISDGLYFELNPFQ